ncbi:HAUS augmin-like complex subunit 2 [Symphorus nematophorus]
MLQEDVSLSPSSVTPAGSLLSRWVSRQIVSQEQIDSASSQLSPAFSSHLYEAEQRIRLQRQLDEVKLQMELLQVENQNADITHDFYLSRRFHVFQMFCVHLQELLKEQDTLKQRLTRPLVSTNLSVQAHLHRSVVDLVKKLLDFMETLEDKLVSVRCSPTAGDDLIQLNMSLDQLLAHVVDVQTVSNQVLRWKDGNRGSGVSSDSYS